MPFVALAVGVVSLIACIWLRLRFTRPEADKVARATRVRSTKSYAEAIPGEFAKVEGTVQASDEGLVPGPMSKVPAVWCRVEVTEDRGDDSFAPLTTVVESRPFLVGGALIAGAFTPIGVLAQSGVACLGTMSSGPVVEASPAVGEFLARHGHTMESKDGFARRREYTESRLEPGAHVFVLGLRSAARAHAQPSGYRDGEILDRAEIKPELVVLGTEEDVLRAARRKFGGADLLVIGSLFLMVFPMLGWMVFAILSALGYGDGSPSTD